MTRTMSLALAALLATTGAASAQEKFTFALNWFPVGDHAAYWVALDKGYYKAKGLDVTLENSKGSGDVIAKVDTGRADAGLADTAVVIASVARGTTVKTVGMVFDQTPLNIFSLKSKPLLKPKDLEGASLGAPPGDGQRQVFPAFVGGRPQAGQAGVEGGEADAGVQAQAGLGQGLGRQRGQRLGAQGRRFGGEQALDPQAVEVGDADEIGRVLGWREAAEPGGEVLAVVQQSRVGRRRLAGEQRGGGAEPVLADHGEHGREIGGQGVDAALGDGVAIDRETGLACAVRQPRRQR